jgi:hypothetical protein
MPQRRPQIAFNSSPSLRPRSLPRGEPEVNRARLGSAAIQSSTTPHAVHRPSGSVGDGGSQHAHQHGPTEVNSQWQSLYPQRVEDERRSRLLVLRVPSSALFRPGLTVWGRSARVTLPDRGHRSDLPAPRNLSPVGDDLVDRSATLRWRPRLLPVRGGDCRYCVCVHGGMRQPG